MTESRIGGQAPSFKSFRGTIVGSCLAEREVSRKSPWKNQSRLSGDLLSLSGQGTAPARATVDFYRDQGLDCIPTGPGSLAHLSFTVPGVVDAYLSLLERYGTLSLARVSGAGHPAGGEWFSRLAEHGASGPKLDGIRSARDDFYRGDLARTLVNSAKSVGGILELAARGRSTFSELRRYAPVAAAMATLSPTFWAEWPGSV